MGEKVIGLLMGLATGLAGAASLNDSLVYDIALEVPSDGEVTKSHIYNRLTHSAAQRTTASTVSKFTGDASVLGTPDPIRIEQQTVNIPIYGQVSYQENVLVFPQSTAEDGGKLYTFRQGVTLTGVPLTSNMTVYCRYWLDPSAASTDYKNTGMLGRLFGCSFSPGNNSSVPPYGFYEEIISNYGYQYARFNFSWYNNTADGYHSLPPGKWCDLVLVLRTDEVALKTYLTWYGRANGSGFAGHNWKYAEGEEMPLKYTNESLCSVLRFNDTKVTLACDAALMKGGWVEMPNGYKDRGTFRGGISRFRIYNRPMSADEVRMLLTEAHGGAVVCGSANGSANEFAAAAETPEEVFDPYTMSSDRMRGRLTSDHPSLTIDVPAKGCNDGLCKMLSLKPVLDGLAGGSATVDVSVNGRKVGELDLANPKDRILYIRGRNIATNAFGCVRYVITRTGNTAGTLGIDALEIGGSWGEGQHHRQNKFDPTGVWGNEEINTYVGHRAATNYLANQIMGPENGTGAMTRNQKTDISFYVPEDVAQHRETSYVFGYRYSDQGVAGKRPVIDLYLNGTLFRSIVGPIDWYTAYTNVFAAGTLQAGLNTLSVSNATPPEVVIPLSYFSDIFPDYYRFLVKPPPQGLMMIVR